MASADGRRQRRAERTRASRYRQAGGRFGTDAGSSTGRVATALAGLRLVDVRPAKDVAKDKPAATATYRTFDGLVLAIEGYAEGDKRYVRVSPSVDESAARAVLRGHRGAGRQGWRCRVGSAKAARCGGVRGGVRRKTTPATSPDSVVAQTREEAAKLEPRLTGWSFEIPDWSYDAIFAQ